MPLPREQLDSQTGSLSLTYRHKIRVRGKNIAIKAQSAIETFNVPLDIEEKRINVGAENKIIKQILKSGRKIQKQIACT